MARLAAKPAFAPIDYNAIYKSKSEHADYVRETERTDAAYKKLQAGHKAAVKAGKLEGRIWTYPVGDGLALYVVSKASPLTLQWIPWGDRWEAPYVAIRGLRAADIERSVFW